MNPGLSEEAGETARGAIDALKSTPVVLALVIFNVMYLGLGAYQQIKETEERARMIGDWVSEHREMATLLSRCIVPGPGLRLETEPAPPQYRPQRNQQPQLQSDESHPVELPPIRPLPAE